MLKIIVFYERTFEYNNSNLINLTMSPQLHTNIKCGELSEKSKNSGQ